MKLAVNLLALLACIALSLSSCQQSADSSGESEAKETYRKEPLSSFDFEQDPLQSDVAVLKETTSEEFKVTDTDVMLALTQDKHYYKFFYYSKLDTVGAMDLVTMLGFYDTYYDLLLVSFEGKEVVDKVVIASFAGDTEDFDNTSAQMLGRREVSLVQVKGERFFEQDSTSIELMVESKVLINADGSFETTVTSNQKADSLGVN